MFLPENILFFPINDVSENGLFFLNVYIATTKKNGFFGQFNRNQTKKKYKNKKWFFVVKKYQYTPTNDWNDDCIYVLLSCLSHFVQIIDFLIKLCSDVCGPGILRKKIGRRLFNRL